MKYKFLTTTQIENLQDYQIQLFIAAKYLASTIQLILIIMIFFKKILSR